MLITVSIVTYNSQAVIAHCLTSMPEGVRVIVVDNASSDDTCHIIREQFPKVELIENEQNIGFGRAHNQALVKATTPFGLILNPDAELREGCLEALLTAAEDFPKAGILAPSLLDENEQPQNNSFNRMVFERTGSNPHPLPEGPLCAEFLSGAALLVRMDAFREIGGFDEKLFLFYEDDDLCLRMAEAGHNCVLVPQAKVFHVAGKSSPVTSWPSIRLKYSHMASSEIYFYSKHRGKWHGFAHGSQRLLICAAKSLLYALIGKGFKAQKYFAQLLGILRFAARP